MSAVVQCTSSWKGLSDIKHLVIFGDSYSSVLGTLPRNDLKPTPSEPLAVPFPGELLWNEEGQPNWVGHFITRYRPGPKYKPGATQQDKEYLDSPLLVYDYAIGGNVVTGVQNQVSAFLRGAGAKPDWASWTATDTLFVTWVGINDCAYHKVHDKNIEALMKIEDKLYDAGARNFLFIDVPPIELSPAVPLRNAAGASASYINWNTNLSKGISTFSSTHPEVTTMLFSSHEAFRKILENPKDHGMRVDHVKKVGGDVWVDRLHPTTAVHNHVARYITEFLEGI